MKHKFGFAVLWPSAASRYGGGSRDTTALASVTKHHHQWPGNHLGRMVYDRAAEAHARLQKGNFPKMSRRRAPTAILKLGSAATKHVGRLKQRSDFDDDDFEPLGDPPKCLKAAQRKIWRELQAQLVEGVARRSDRISFEMLVCLVARQREYDKLNAKLSGIELRAIMRLMRSFGLSECRSGSAPKNSRDEGDENPLNSFISRVN